MDLVNPKIREKGRSLGVRLKRACYSKHSARDYLAGNQIQSLHDCADRVLVASTPRIRKSEPEIRVKKEPTPVTTNSCVITLETRFNLESSAVSGFETTFDLPQDCSGAITNGDLY